MITGPAKPVRQRWEGKDASEGADAWHADITRSVEIYQDGPGEPWRVYNWSWGEDALEYESIVLADFINF